MERVEVVPDFDGWQAAARRLLRAGIPPGAVRWLDVGAARAGTPAEGVPGDSARTASPARGGAAGGSAVPTSADEAAPPPGPAIRVPRVFLDTARCAARHPDSGRWHLLYRVLWRLVHEGRQLIEDRSDADVARLFALAAETGASVPSGKPSAGEARGAGGAAAVPVLAGPGGAGAEPSPPAHRPLAAGGAAPFVPAGASLDELREAARGCTGCHLYRGTTQTVFGRGPREARIVLVGEQPGDQEDLQGAPFVGPAGEVLDRALGEVGLDRGQLYVTNVVKHFKFLRAGKRRIHQTPTAGEVLACQPWLEAELALIRPEVLVCLGATAARALLGPAFRIMRDHGRCVPTRWAPRTMATLHPSAVLRGEDEAAQARLYRLLVEDLRQIAGPA